MINERKKNKQNKKRKPNRTKPKEATYIHIHIHARESTPRVPLEILEDKGKEAGKKRREKDGEKEQQRYCLVPFVRRQFDFFLYFFFSPWYNSQPNTMAIGGYFCFKTWKNEKQLSYGSGNMRKETKTVIRFRKFGLFQFAKRETMREIEGEIERERDQRRIPKNLTDKNQFYMQYTYTTDIRTSLYFSTSLSFFFSLWRYDEAFHHFT